MRVFGKVVYIALLLGENMLLSPVSIVKHTFRVQALALYVEIEGAYYMRNYWPPIMRYLNTGHLAIA